LKEIVPMKPPGPSGIGRGHLAELHARFLALLPRIELHGEVYFRHVRCPHRRADCVAEMVALCWKWYVRATEQGKDVSRFVSVLATFAARHVRSGRRLCGQERGKDALSPLAQARHNFVAVKLPDYATLSGSPLFEALADNTRSPVDEQAAFRIDFPEWLSTLGARNRDIAEDMALGHRTQELSRKYGVCEARVSQLRREFYLDWHRFHGDLDLA
jgi:hypothetical protein